MTSGLRTALWISVPLNALGVIVFGSAALGRPVMDLPLPIAPFYAAQLTMTIALFGGVYAWLAQQTTVNRPLLFIGGLGKLAFFLVFVAYAVAGDLPWSVVANGLPDLILGTLYLTWLARHR